MLCKVNNQKELEIMDKKQLGIILIEDIYKKKARVEECGFEPKSIILSYKHFGILSEHWAYGYLPYTKSAEILGLPVITDVGIKGIQIGV